MKIHSPFLLIFFFVRMATIRILFALPVFPLACITTKMISLVFRNVSEYVPGWCFYCKYSASAVWSVHLGLHYYRKWMKVANVNFYSLKATLKQLNFSQINYFHLPHHKKKIHFIFRNVFLCVPFFSILIYLACLISLFWLHEMWKLTQLLTLLKTNIHILCRIAQLMLFSTNCNRCFQDFLTIKFWQNLIVVTQLPMFKYAESQQHSI